MKRIFLRIAAAAVLGLLVLPGCKKNSGSGSGSSSGNGSTYYIKFKLNGVQVEYDSQPFAGISFSKPDSLYTCVIAAYKDINKGLENAITFTIFSNSAIVAGASYNDPGKAKRVSTGDIVPQNTIFYYDSTAIGFLTMGMFVDKNGNIAVPGAVANAKLTISEMASSYLKGTFSGTVYKSSSLTQYYSITEGEFYLKRS